MPRGDKTGPMGVGPMTGRGSGLCMGIGTAVRCAELGLGSVLGSAEINGARRGKGLCGSMQRPGQGRGRSMQGEGRGMGRGMRFNQEG